MNATLDDDDELSGNVRKLKFGPRQFIDIRQTLNELRQVWETRLAEKNGAKVTVFHWDESFNASLCRDLVECGSGPVCPLQRADAVMYAINRGATSELVLWYDIDKDAPGTLLEEISEALRTPWIPTLVLVPGEGALHQLVKKHGGSFFDVVAIYDRKTKGALTPLLAKMRGATSDLNSARGLIEQLRLPFRPGSAAPAKKLSLADARTLSAQLALKPGKRYWALSGLIPHLMAHKEIDEAQILVEALVKERPNAFNTVLMQHVVARRLPGNATPAIDRELVAKVLQLPDITRDRLFRVGEVLDRWRSTEALADLLDGWYARGDLADDHQRLYLAGRYYRLLGKPETSGLFLAMATQADALRPDYLGALARSFADRRLHEFCAETSRLTIQACPQQEDAFVMLVQSLISERRLRDARKAVDEALERFPSSREVLDLKQKLS